jgi:ATP-binding cassette, subfamily B, bacterial
VSKALKESLRAWPRALPYLKPYRGRVALSTLFMLIGAAAGLLEPWPMALLVDSVLGDKPFPDALGGLAGSPAGRIVLAAGLGLAITMVASGVMVATQYINTKLSMRMVLDLRSHLFQHVQRLSFAYHDDRRTGELMGRINGQATSLEGVTVAALPLIQNGLMLVGMFVVAFTINKPVALLSLCVVPFIYYSTGYYGSRIGPRVRKVKGMEMRSLHIVLESMQMLRVVAAFNREDHEYDKFRAQGEEAVDARVKVTVRQTLFTLVVNLVTALGTAGVIGVGAWQVLNGDLTIGRLLVLLHYIKAVYKPLEEISSTMNSIQEDLIGFEMALELLETDPDVVEMPDAVQLDRPKGGIRFEDVSFCYGGRAETLKGVSLVVKPGECVGIVGPTGAGKSTLVGLLPRFYDPSDGRILLSGHDVRDLTLASLRAQMSIVLQEPLLFSGTIEENIRYGRLDATRAEVIRAARDANAHDFIERLPRGYRTKLGERGAQLSGGERQRLCIARAFLKNAPILILDEPTSSVDSRTEGVILDALRRLMKGRTTFMIAHRLSTVCGADQIVVLNEGKVVERGTHDKLLGRDGLYRVLWDAQARSAALDPAKAGGGA